MILRSTKSTMKTLQKNCPASFFSFLFTLPSSIGCLPFVSRGVQFFGPTLGWTSLLEILPQFSFLKDPCCWNFSNKIPHPDGAPGRSTPFWCDVQSPLDVVEDLEVPKVSDTPKALITSQAVVSHSPATWFFSHIFSRVIRPFIRVK